MRRDARPRLLLAIGLLSIRAVGLYAQSPLITHISVTDSNVLLTWDTPTNRFIVERCSSLTGSSVCCALSTGAVANTVVCPIGDESTAFFGLQFGLLALEFPDAALEQVLIGAANPKHAPTNKFWDVDVPNITSVSGTFKGITNLTGSDVLTDLSVVNLGNNAISDLGPIAGLTKLTIVNFINNDITEVAPLAGLTNVTKILMFMNQISDLTPFSGLTDLADLWIGDNEIEDLTPLSSLTQLTRLELYDNQISNLTALSGMTNLTDLRISGNEIEDLPPLAPLTQLTSLSLHANLISNLSPLSGLMSLVALHLHNNEISSLSPLSALGDLTLLNLENNQVTDLSPLVANAAGGGIGDETHVYLSGNPLSSNAETVQIPALEGYDVTVHWP